MLKITSISLIQFKNYTNRNFTFTNRITGISGKNGVGKTNILDAIYYLCLTKSYFSSTDAVNVQQGTKGFRIEGKFCLNAQNETAVCIMRETGKKEFLLNNEPYEKFSKHIGHYPCVIIAPDDAILITGGSEERRHFLDALLSQIDAEYLMQLIRYNKLLQQRNQFLKNRAQTESLDEALLFVLDEQLLPCANYIFDKRKTFLVSFLPKVKRLYIEIAKQEEKISLVYNSKLLEVSYEELLLASRPKDLLLQRTTVGIHRDDINIQSGDQPFKNIASQGQRKSLLFALKLTELEVLKTHKKLEPLLLLDDIFEKLDESRIASLLEKVCIENDGQVFITDTNENRLQEHLSALKLNFSSINLQ